MKLLALIIVVAGIITATGASVASESTPHMLSNQRLANFKQALEFDIAVQSERKDEFVDLALAELETPPQLNGWKIIHHELQTGSEDGSSRLYWQLENAGGTVTIIVTLYRPEKNSAAAHFLEVANSTTTMKIPYVKGPPDVGTLSAVDKAMSEDIFWFFENVSVELTRFQSDAPHLEIARWLHRKITESRKPFRQ